MTTADANETTEWPQTGCALLERNSALAALEEAWRNGLLVENEPSA